MIVKKNTLSLMVLLIGFISFNVFAKSEDNIFTKYKIENSNIAVTQRLIQENVLNGNYKINAKISYKNSDYIEQIEDDIIPIENIIINGKKRSSGYYQKSKTNIDKVKIQFENLQHDKMLDFNKFILDYRLVPEDLHTSVDINIYLKNANNEKMIATTMIAGSDELYLDEVVDVAGKDWIPKDNIYLLKRELNFGYDDKWRYAQDANRMVIQKRFNKKINTLKYLNVEVDSKYTLSMVNLLVGRRESEKYDQVVNWERLRRQELPAGDVIYTRIDIASLVHDTLLRYEDVYLKEIVIFVFGDQNVITAKAIRNIEFFKFLALNPEYKGQEVINIESMHMMKNKGTRKFIASIDKLKDWYQGGYVVDDIDMLIRMNTHNKSGGIHIDDIMYSNVNVSKISKINQNNCLLGKHLGYVDNDLYLDPTDCIKIRQVYPYSYLSLKDNYKNNQLTSKNIRLTANKNAGYNVDDEDGNVNFAYHFTNIDDSIEIDIPVQKNITKKTKGYDVTTQIINKKIDKNIKDNKIYDDNSKIELIISHNEEVNVTIDQEEYDYQINGVTANENSKQKFNNNIITVNTSDKKSLRLKISPVANPYEMPGSIITGNISVKKIKYEYVTYKKIKEKKIKENKRTLLGLKGKQVVKKKNKIKPAITYNLARVTYKKDFLATEDATKNKNYPGILNKHYCVNNLKTNICSDYPLQNIKLDEDSIEFKTSKNTYFELNMLEFPKNLDQAYLRYSIFDGYEYIKDSTVKLIYKNGEKKIFRIKPSKNMLLHNTDDVKSATINVEIQNNAFIKLSNISVFNIEKDVEFNPLSFQIISPYSYNLEINDYQILSNEKDKERILDTSTENKLQLLTSLQENDPLIIKWTTPVNIRYEDIKNWALHYELPSNVLDDDARLTMAFKYNDITVEKKYSIDKTIGSINYSLIDDIKSSKNDELNDIHWTLTLVNKAIDISKWEQVKIYTVINRMGLTNAYEIYKNLSLFEIDGNEYSISNINNILDDGIFNNAITIDQTYRSTGTIQTIGLIDNDYFNVDSLILGKISALPYELLGTISASANSNSNNIIQDKLSANTSPNKVIYLLILIACYMIYKVVKRLKNSITIMGDRIRSIKILIKNKITTFLNIIPNTKSKSRSIKTTENSELTEQTDDYSLPLSFNAAIGYACMLTLIWRVIHIGTFDLIEYLLMCQILTCSLLNAKYKGIVIQKKYIINAVNWIKHPSHLIVVFLSYMTIANAVFYSETRNLQWILFVLPVIHSAIIFSWINNDKYFNITEILFNIIKVLLKQLLKILKLLISINYIKGLKFLIAITVPTLIFIMSLTSGSNNTINNENYYFTAFAIVFAISWLHICSILISIINKFVNVEQYISHQESVLYYIGFIIFLFVSIVLNLMDMGVFSGYSAIVSYFMLATGIYYKIIIDKLEKNMSFQK